MPKTRTESSNVLTLAHLTRAPPPLTATTRITQPSFHPHSEKVAKNLHDSTTEERVHIFFVSSAQRSHPQRHFAEGEEEGCLVDVHLAWAVVLVGVGVGGGLVLLVVLSRGGLGGVHARLDLAHTVPTHQSEKGVSEKCFEKCGDGEKGSGWVKVRTANPLSLTAARTAAVELRRA